MAIWFLLALMTGAAVMAVLWPLSRRAAGPSARETDTEFYRDQIAEIERDEARSLITSEEAESARAEAARRLLRAAPPREVSADPLGEPGLRRRRAASAVALSTVPLVALAVYGAYGSPLLPAQPAASRLQAGSQTLNLATALARIENHLAQDPDDGRGWEVIAPVYLRGGRAGDAAKAYQMALRRLGETAPRLANYGEALVAASDGVISADARATFERALQLDATLPKARYYLAQAAEQDGDTQTARSRYAELVASSPGDAPWLPLVRERLERLEGGGAAAEIAGLPQPDQRAAIRGMVEGLATRLDKRGGTSDEWARLVRSYMVLGERAKAEAALDRGRQALAVTGNSSSALDDLARDLGAAAPEPLSGGPKP